MSRGLRIASVVLCTAGAVVLIDVGLTLAWKEPLSTIYGAIAQRGLSDEVTALNEEYERTDDPAEIRRAARRMKRRLDSSPGQGEGIGRLSIPAIDVDYAMVEGTDLASLKKGPGHYSGTVLPGAGNTVGIAGHRTTYLAPFRRIDELERGDEIFVEMPYARLRYEVEKARVVEPTQTEVVRRRKDERLVLTACHPLYSAAQRYVVFAAPAP